MPRIGTTALVLLVLGGALLFAACGGEGTGGAPDAGGADAGTDAGGGTLWPACDEFRDPQLTVSSLPLAFAGNLAGAGADMEAPNECDVVDAPFGMSSSGADVVIEVIGLAADTEYVVRIDSADDLAFYVARDCSTPTGPASRECLLFVDAEIDAPEVGRFRTEAGQDRAFVVVDYYQPGYPPATDFMAQVYEAECDTSDECTDPTTPICQHGRCAGCSSDFDCLDPALPLCDEPTYTCVAGGGACIGDDASEQEDDGPAGATLLEPGTPRSGAICDNPDTERDFFRFDVVTPGEDWSLHLSWSGTADLDLAVYDTDGNLAGLSFYEQPEQIDLTYLPAGNYYVSVDNFTQSGTQVSTPYTLSATAAPDACTSTADCAAEFRNQVFRGTCTSGACERIDGEGARAPGERCDSASDCLTGTSCASFFFTADADTRMTCGTFCDTDAECAGMGGGYLCTDYLVDNFCVQRCSSDDQCPTIPGALPTTPPWLRFSCQTTTGKCMPP